MIIIQVFYNSDIQKKPIKAWLPDGYIEDECLKQAINLSNLPFICKHVALMPDTHSGYGMPIGGVIATDGVVIPNAVGVDIGCGMAYAETYHGKHLRCRERFGPLHGQRHNRSRLRESRPQVHRHRD